MPICEKFELKLPKKKVKYLPKIRCVRNVCVSQLLQATIVCKRKFPIEILPSIDIEGEHIIIDYY